MSFPVSKTDSECLQYSRKCFQFIELSLNMFLDTLDVSFGPMKVTEYRFSVRFKKPPGIRDFVTLLKKVVLKAVLQ